MEYLTRFVSAQVKYDLILDKFGSQASEEWTECRINMRPLEASGQRIQIYCYPRNYNDLLPYFVFDIDSGSVQVGPIASRTKAHAYGFLWTAENKKCKFFFAFDDCNVYDEYTKFVNDLLRFMEQNQNEKDVVYTNKPKQSCGEVITFTNKNDSKRLLESIPVDVPKDVSVETMRVSDASGVSHEVVLRPKVNQNHAMVMRPIGIISNTNKTISEQMPALPPRKFQRAPKVERTTKKTINEKKSIFKMFKKREQLPLTEDRTYVRFQEPLIDERLSLNDAQDLDLDWCQMNAEYSNLIETAAPEVSNRLSENKGDDGNRDPNFSQSCTLGEYVSEVGLIGANSNHKQIQSEFFFEKNADAKRQSLTVEQQKRLSIASTDSSGYVRMYPISSKREINRFNVCKAENIDLQPNYNKIALHSGFICDTNSVPLKTPPPVLDVGSLAKIDDPVQIAVKNTMSIKSIDCPKVLSEIQNKALSEVPASTTKFNQSNENWSSKKLLEDWLDTLNEISYNFDEVETSLEIAAECTKNISIAKKPEIDSRNNRAESNRSPELMPFKSFNCSSLNQNTCKASMIRDDENKSTHDTCPEKNYDRTAMQTDYNVPNTSEPIEELIEPLMFLNVFYKNAADTVNVKLNYNDVSRRKNSSVMKRILCKFKIFRRKTARLLSSLA